MDGWIILFVIAAATSEYIALNKNLQRNSIIQLILAAIDDLKTKQRTPK